MQTLPPLRLQKSGENEAIVVDLREGIFNRLKYEALVAIGMGIVAYAAAARFGISTLTSDGYAQALSLMQGAGGTFAAFEYSLLYSILAPIFGFAGSSLDYVKFLVVLPPLFAFAAGACLYGALRLWKFSRTESVAAVVLSLVGGALIWQFLPMQLASAPFMAIAALSAGMLLLVASARAEDYGLGKTGSVVLAVLSATKFTGAALLVPASAVVPAGLLLAEAVEYRRKYEEVLASPIPVVLRVLALLVPIIIALAVGGLGAFSFSLSSVEGFGGSFGFAAGFALLPFLFLYWNEKHELAPAFSALSVAAIIGSGFTPLAALLAVLPCAYGIRAMRMWKGYAPLLRVLALFLPVAVAVFSASYAGFGMQKAAVFGGMAGAVAIVVGYFYGWNDSALARYGFVFALCAGALMFAFSYQPAALSEFMLPAMQQALSEIGKTTPGAQVAAFASPEAIRLLANGENAFANQAAYAKWLAANASNAGVPKKTVVLLEPAIFYEMAGQLGEAWTLRAYQYSFAANDSSGSQLAIFYSPIEGILIAHPHDAQGKLLAAPSRILDPSGSIIDFLPLGQSMLLYPGEPADYPGNMLIRPGKEYGSRVLWLYQNENSFAKAYRNGTMVALVVG